MKKGIGPRGLGAPKSAAKMYGDSPAKQTGETAMLDQAKRRGGLGVGAENKAIRDARRRTKRVSGSGYDNSNLKAAERDASFNFREDYKEQQGQANKYSNLTGKYVYTKPEKLGSVKKNIRRKVNP